MITASSTRMITLKQRIRFLLDAKASSLEIRDALGWRVGRVDAAGRRTADAGLDRAVGAEGRLVARRGGAAVLTEDRGARRAVVAPLTPAPFAAGPPRPAAEVGRTGGRAARAPGRDDGRPEGGRRAPGRPGSAWVGGVTGSALDSQQSSGDLHRRSGSGEVACSRRPSGAGAPSWAGPAGAMRPRRRCATASRGPPP